MSIITYLRFFQACLGLRQPPLLALHFFKPFSELLFFHPYVRPCDLSFENIHLFLLFPSSLGFAVRRLDRFVSCAEVRYCFFLLSEDAGRFADVLQASVVFGGELEELGSL